MFTFPTLPDTFALDLPESDETPQPAAPAGLFARLKRFDDERPGFPLEHWLVGGVGALLLLSAGRRGSLLSRMVKRAIGAALIGRAASGRDGVAKLLPTRGPQR